MRASPPIATGLAFVDDLHVHGTAVAIVDADGRTVTYTQLDRLVSAAARRLPGTRRLVQVVGANHLDAIVGYLGALRAGHAVLLCGADGREALAGAYRPDTVSLAGTVVDDRGEPAHELHPDLALLLSTSGSTGSPKVVRLSYASVDANARAIAGYLDLTPSDRAITSLPLHYCYGLSVLHSHLATGAALVCTDASVVDPCFWDAVDRHRVTNLAGVPHTFELIEHAGVPGPMPRSVRFLTQAGGRMDPDRIRRFASRAASEGWELFVMYGQTEATARMAYLPPALATERAGAVGVPVTGGSFRLEPFEGSRPGEGEVVFRGPNVMMGYAEGPSDLWRAAELDELRTGDIGRIAPDGLLEIVGRRRHFVKPFGLRIDLDLLDRQLEEHGIAGCVVGDDTGVAVAITDRTDPAATATLLRARTGLPAGAVVATALDDLPRLGNGKVDRPATLALVRATAAGAPGTHAAGPSVAAMVAGLLGAPDFAPGDTFVSLGGDSLSYVEVSVRLEERLGHLPDGWHLIPLGSLDGLTRSRRRVARVETSVVLRAVAIVLIVGNHAGTFALAGGAHVLFAAAGANFARFQLTTGSWWRSIVRLAVPSVVWIGGAAALSDGFDLAHVGLVHGWVGGQGRWIYWFVEALVQVLVAVAALLSIPSVRRAERRHPFGFPAVLLGLALLVRFDVVPVPGLDWTSFRSHEIAWVFLLGWTAGQARTPLQRASVTAVALAAVPGFFHDPDRGVVLLAGLALLVWVPNVPVPRPLHRAVGVVAGASLYTYLTHVQVHPLLSDRSPVAGVVLSLVAGVAVARVADPFVRSIGRQTPSPWRPAPAANLAAPACVSPARTGTSPRRVSLASASSSGSPHCS